MNIGLGERRLTYLLLFMYSVVAVDLFARPWLTDFIALWAVAVVVCCMLLYQE